MHILVDQLEESLASGHYFLSLFIALALPDIAGALGSPNGEAKSTKYVQWFENWVRPRFSEIARESVPESMRENVPDLTNPLDGDACYRFRCSLLHQGSTQHSKSPFSRIIFIEPNATTNIVHYGQIYDVLCIDLNLFCREVIAGVRLWLAEVEGTEPFLSNHDKFVRRYDTGLEPYIGGVPVIG